MFFHVRRLDVAAKEATVDFRNLAFATDDAALQLLGHRFADLVRQDERGFVRRPEIARQRQHRLALDLVAEDRDRHEVAPQGQLVEGEQRARRDREIALQARQRKRGAPFGRRAS